MTPTEAAKLLEVPADATPEQLEARFLELRTRLEDKIAKAPTPGLKAKYRESLEQITAAFETLALAADGSALPVLQRQRTEDGGQKTAGGPSTREAAATGGGVPPLRDASAKPAAAQKSSSKEFLVVAVIALAVLGAGGWFVMKTRAEKAEQARLAAEARTAADLKAAAEKTEAENKRKADEEEKVRAAAAAKAEQDRLEKLAADVRVRLAEAKFAWEQIEREERNAERTLNELRSEERSARDLSPAQRAELAARAAAGTGYLHWLTDYLGAHPAKLGQVKASELLSARQVDDAAREAGLLLPLIATAKQEIAGRQAAAEAQVYGTLVLEPENPSDRWQVTDAFGRHREGQGAARLDKLALGAGTIALTRSGLTQTTPFTLAADTPSQKLTFLPAEIVITANAPGAEVYERGQRLGTVPLTLAARPAGEVEFLLQAPDFQPATLKGVAQPGQKLALAANLERVSDLEIIRKVAGPLEGTWDGGKDYDNALHTVTRRRFVTISVEKGTVRVWITGKPYGDPRETPLVLMDRERGTVGFQVFGDDPTVYPATIEDGRLIAGNRIFVRAH